MEEKKYHGRLDDAAIEELKKKHGEVFEIVVPMDDDEREYAVGYVKKPTRQILGATSRLLDINPIKANELILNDIWLAGDERLRTNDELFLSISSRITDLISVRYAELKKK